MNELTNTKTCTICHRTYDIVKEFKEVVIYKHKDGCSAVYTEKKEKENGMRENI